MKRRGIEMRMVLQGDCKPSRFDRPLIKAVARARRWSHELLSGQVLPSTRLHGGAIVPRYVRDLLPLACLSPRIVETIFEGRQPAELTVIGLTRRIDLPLSGVCRNWRLVSATESSPLVTNRSAARSELTAA